MTKKPVKFGSGRTIIAVFGLTIFLSLFFYLKTELPSWWQKAFAPVVISSLPKEKQRPPLVLETIKDLTFELRGTYGVYVDPLEEGKNYGLNEQNVFPAASLMKLPVMLLLYQEAEAGRINLEEKYQLQEKDKVGGAGILQSKPAGSSYTYRQLSEDMGYYSDNTAFEIMVKILGRAKIQALIDRLGMNKTSFSENKTSPEDIGSLFRQLYEGKIVSREHQEEILDYLTKTGYEERIPAGIPAGVRVAHKIGTEIGSFSDAGIIFGKQDFILVIMSESAKESEAVVVLPKIASAVWEFENKK